MDRRYSSSSSSTATETAKKAAIGNTLNSSMRLRNGLSTDSTVSPSHRKSFPTSDVGSSFNSTTQVRAITYFLLLSTFRQRQHRIKQISISHLISWRSITSSDCCYFLFSCSILFHFPFKFLSDMMSRGHKPQHTVQNCFNDFISTNERRLDTSMASSRGHF